VNIVFMLIFTALALTIVTACGDDDSTAVEPTTVQPTATESSPGLPNPASVYCETAGGNLELESGTGTCTFPDESQCEEWAFFRGECSVGDNYEIASVSESIAVPDGSQISVRGIYFKGTSGIEVLCDSLAESFPPQCFDPKLEISGFRSNLLPRLNSESEITWTDTAVILAGTVRDGVLTAP